MHPMRHAFIADYYSKMLNHGYQQESTKNVGIESLYNKKYNKDFFSFSIVWILFCKIVKG